LDGRNVLPATRPGGSTRVAQFIPEPDFNDLERNMATYTGGLGNDSLAGGTGNDSINGGLTGNDTLGGSTGEDTLNGGAGNDTYIINSGFDTIVGESATSGSQDTLIDDYGRGPYVLPNFIENLILRNTTTYFGWGNSLGNTITGNAADNGLDGGDGNDTIYGGGGNDSITGGFGNTTLAGNDYLYGEAGNDTLDGGYGNDSLYGGFGNDLLIGGAGNDYLDGGDGDDTYSIGTADGTDVISDTGATGTDTLLTDINGDISAKLSIEHITLRATTAVTALGNGSDNKLTGNSVANTLTGAAGNDTLIGGGGNDTLIGGEGNDVYVLVAGDGNDVITETGASLNDEVQSAITYSVAALGNVENLTLTGTASIDGTGNGAKNVIRGNDGANKLDGGANDDSLFGGSASDILLGGEGNDTLDGGLYNDQLDGQNGSDVYIIGDASTLDGYDTVNDTGATGTDEVWAMGPGYTLEVTTGIENLTLKGAATAYGYGNGADNRVTGNTLANDLRGAGGNDTLMGDLGDDTLDGGTGIDSLDGGVGNDVYKVDNIADVIKETAGNGTADKEIVSVTGVTQAAEVELMEASTGALTLSAAGTFVMNGNAADNRITGSQTVSSTLNGADGNDTLTGGVADDILSGGNGNDSLLGGDGNDALGGGANADTLDGGAGADSMAGGAGADTYYVDNLGDQIVELAETGVTDTVITSVSEYVLADEVEVLKVAANVDTLSLGYVDLTGNAQANRIEGAQNLINYVDGGAGNDTLIGGDLDDQLSGGAGLNRLVGGKGNDVYFIDDANQDIAELAGEGTDAICISTAFDVTLGANIENQFMALPGAQSLFASQFGAFNVTGNDLDNILNGSNAVNRLDGGKGNDRLIAFGGDDSVYGGEGNDSLSGGLGNDLLDGGAGNDTLSGGVGNDNMTGGAGNDTYLVDSAADLITEVAEVGSKDTEIVSITGLILADNVENMGVAVVTATSQLTLETSGSIYLTGNSLDNVITGSNQVGNLIDGDVGNDTLIGGQFNDELYDEVGTNRYEGGQGDDVYYIADASQTVVEADGAGNDAIVLLQAFNVTLAANIENQLILANTSQSGLAGLLGGFNVTGNQLGNQLNGSNGSNVMSGLEGNDTINAYGGADSVYGGDGADSLNGGAGNDLLDGGTGSDTLVGGTGNDTLVGGAGDDVYFIDAPDDIVQEVVNNVDAGGKDVVFTGVTISAASIGGIETFNLQGTAAINVTGNALDNTINGNEGANALDGAGGSDLLNGGAGNDTLDGGDGDDALFGGAGDDLMRGGLGDDSYHVTDAGDQTTETTAGLTGGYDTVYTTVDNWTLASGIEDLVLMSGVRTGSGNGDGNGISGNNGDNILNGNGGDDVLLGNGGIDMLYGGDGRDTLAGGDGVDYLDGGLGGDTYLVSDFGDTYVDLDTASNVTDTMVFLTSNYNDLWFAISGSDLVITDLNSQQSNTVRNWALGASNHIERLTDSNSGRSITDAGVSTLIAAMANYGAAPTTAAGVLAAQQSLSPVELQNWLLG